MSFDFPVHPRPLAPEAQALLAAFAEANRPSFAEVGVTLARQAYDASNKMLDLAPEEVQSTHDLMIPVRDGQIAARHYKGIGVPEQGNKAIIFSHGGGFVVGGLDGYDGLCRHLANSNQCVVISLDYRMGPEYHFPTAPDDVFDAWQWIHENASSLAIDSGRLIGMGDSAGGNLTAQATVRMRDLGKPAAAQILVYPAVKATADTNSQRAYAEGHLLDKATMEWFMDNYLGPNASKVDERLDLLKTKDLSGLPPTFFQLAECDPLVDEGIEYANALLSANNSVKLTIYPGMLHAFYHMGQYFALARQAHKDASTWLEEIAI